MARHADDPLRYPVLAAFNAQVRALRQDPWSYGAAFTPVVPDRPPRIAEGYFSIQRGQDYAFVDGLQRPVLPSAWPLDDPLAGVYEKLLVSHKEPRAWDPSAVRRITGFLFTGSQVPPHVLRESGGLWSNFMNPCDTNPVTGTLPERIAGARWLPFAFNLRSYNTNPIGGAFVSLTRSVHVARHFAMKAREKAGDGYVYVVRVVQGLDCSHPGARGKQLHVAEQEVAAPGMVPWSRVVAYRRMVRNPAPAGQEAPPEFMGPIFVRNQFRGLEPRAYLQIVRALSGQSRYTQAFAEGQNWQGKLALSEDKAYRAKFQDL